MKKFVELSTHYQKLYLMKPIIKTLKKAGGRSTTKELRRAVVADDDNIPANVLTATKKSKNGNIYLPFKFPFNFAVKDMITAGYLERPYYGTVMLTKLGRRTAEQLAEQVNEKLLSLEKQQSQPKQTTPIANTTVDDEEPEDEVNNSREDDWRTTLLTALGDLTPAKFELFSRALVKRMNVDIDETIGVKMSGDGGLDGYGYLTTNDFRTTRVAIQAKRWATNHLVSSPEIDKFRGAMDKFRAEYGIFVTTSSFTRDAIRASRIGTRVITLIDGDHLVDLVAKYQLYVKPITTYELGSFFKEKD